MSSIAEKITTIAENEQRVYEVGHNSGYVQGSALKDSKPYIDTSKITDFRYFNQEGKRDFILPYLDTSKGTNFFCFCNGAKELVTVDIDFSKAIQCTQAFNNCSALETVEYLDFSSLAYASTGLSSMFTGCTALKNVTMKPNHLRANISFSACSLLTDKSIQSIIDGLGTNVGARQLTLHADIKAKLTATQKLTITEKGWALA